MHTRTVKLWHPGDNGWSRFLGWRERRTLPSAQTPTDVIRIDAGPRTPTALAAALETDDDHARDERRLAEIERYALAELVGAAPRRDLQGLAQLAARVFEAPKAMIAFIDDTHLRTIATVGFDQAEVPRAMSLCNQVLYDGVPLLSGDITADARYADSWPATTGLARFYASQQLVTPDGEPIGALCVFDAEPHDTDSDTDTAQRDALRDLADRVVDALELQLRTRELTEVVGELRRSNEALAAFAGQVSHDLRNPLTALSANLEIVDDLLTGVAEPAVVAPVRPLVRRAQRSAERMSRLINDVLDLAEVGGELHPARIDTRHLVEEVLEDLATELAGTDLGLGVLHPVVADPVQLRIVVQNLLSNAAKFARPGERAHVEVSTERRPSWWRLVVRDHGRGVDPALRDHVFELFTRLDSSVPGTGVGLATCRRVALAHGGRIGLEETPGGGATVWFEVPADGARPGVVAHRADRAPGPPS